MVEISQRRTILSRMAVAMAAMIVAAMKLGGQNQGARPLNEDNEPKASAEEKLAATSRKLALEENEKDIKKSVEKLFQLASELKEQVDKTDSVKVLSVGMIKKADEIERLAKEIKSRAKG
jgi:hypothetical protein